MASGARSGPRKVNSSGQVETVFTGFINAFSFCPEFGRLQRSIHLTADQSPPKTPPIPTPVSRLKGEKETQVPKQLTLVQGPLFGHAGQRRFCNPDR
jgi:hypothetical protein